MLFSYFDEDEYPILIELIRMMAHDTGVSIDDSDTWNAPEDIEMFEVQASIIPENLRLTFIAGDEEDIAKIVEDYDIEDLHDYLDDVFNSDFSILEGE